MPMPVTLFNRKLNPLLSDDVVGDKRLRVTKKLFRLATASAEA